MITEYQNLAQFSSLSLSLSLTQTQINSGEILACEPISDG